MKNHNFLRRLTYNFIDDEKSVVYPSDKTDDPNYSGEIWIAVNEK